MLPLGARDIILGRYGFVLLSYVVATSVVLGLSFVVPGNGSTPWNGVFFSLGGSILVFSAIVGTQMPFFFRLGYNKGRFYAMAPFFVVIGLVALPSFVGDTLVLFKWVINNQNIASILMFTLGIAILSLSYVVSLLLYKGQK